ncbi:MAG: hypothetical protein R3F41_01995 [Gammaproteobacteria bacterium]|nr:hypothetical protein [Pseudomonadales bacterium]
MSPNESHTSLESRALWQEVLGEQTEAVWQALDVECASYSLYALRTSCLPVWQFATAASLALCAALAFITLKQSTQLADQRLDYVLLQLQSPRASTQLDALLSLRTLGTAIPEQRWPELRNALQNSSDPNVQLATLELMINIGAITQIADIPDLLPSRAPQQRLLEASFQFWNPQEH